jgi:hypothetical protein
VQPVQVDLSTGGLLVNGSSWNGVGWYLHSTMNLTDAARLVQYDFAPRGINVGLLYNSYINSTEELVAFLDLCEQHDFKIIYQVVGKTAPGDLTALTAAVKAVKDHPSLFGYYVCDDCCDRLPHALPMYAQAYMQISYADPFHMVVGASNCHAGSYLFGGTNTNGGECNTHGECTKPPNASLADKVIKQYDTPHTRLCLDITMQENYGASLGSKLSADPKLRAGAPFQVVWNCPSSDGTDSRQTAWETSRFKLTDMWLAVIQGDMTGQLAFIRNPADAGDQDTELGYFAAQTKEMWPALSAPFGSAPPPLVRVSALPAVQSYTYLWLRARAWATPLSSPVGSATCTYIVVANANPSMGTAFQLTLDPPPEESANATRLFDAVYNLTITGGNFSDYIVPGGVHLYRYGAGACHRKYARWQCP